MLITDKIRTQLRKNSQLSAAGDQDHRPVVKFFTPDAQAIWLFTELDADQDTLYGLCDLSLGSPELGYASLAEIQSLRGSLCLAVERDLYFKATKTLSQYAVDAQRHGRIVA